MPPPKLLGDTSSVWGHGCVRGVCRQPSEERSEENTVGLGDKSSIWATIKLNQTESNSILYKENISSPFKRCKSFYGEENQLKLKWQKKVNDVEPVVASSLISVRNTKYKRGIQNTKYITQTKNTKYKWWRWTCGLLLDERRVRSKVGSEFWTSLTDASIITTPINRLLLPSLLFYSSIYFSTFIISVLQGNAISFRHCCKHFYLSLIV